jgi:hypothetical protein
MIKKSRYLLYLSFVLFTCCRVKRNQLPNNIWECFNSEILNTAKLNQEILGKWHWYKDNCVFGKENYFKNKDFSLLFVKDTVFLYSHKTLIQKSQWTIKKIGQNSFKMETNPQINLMVGAFGKCKEYLLFDDRINEECSIWFYKSKK